MSDLKKEVKEIEELMNKPAPGKMYARKDEPLYQVLRCAVEQSGHELANYQYVTLQKQAIHEFNVMKLNMFMNGINVENNSKLEAIEERIAIFEEKLKKGVKNACQ